MMIRESGLLFWATLYVYIYIYIYIYIVYGVHCAGDVRDGFVSVRRAFDSTSSWRHSDRVR